MSYFWIKIRLTNFEFEFDYFDLFIWKLKLEWKDLCWCNVLNTLCNLNYVTDEYLLVVGTISPALTLCIVPPPAQLLWIL